MSMSFKCIWVDCTYRTANLGKLKMSVEGAPTACIGKDILPLLDVLFCSCYQEAASCDVLPDRLAAYLRQTT